MERNYNVTGNDRKALVSRIAELTGLKAVYLGMPTAAYRVGPFEIGRTGILSWDEGTDAESIIAALEKEGFRAEDETEPDHLSISLPDTLTEDQFSLLTRLAGGRATLLKHAFKTDTVEIVRADGQITFPWFTPSDGDHTEAYMIFVTKLVQFIKKAKRVTVQDGQVDNEKFSFRVFLVRIGMTGKEYKEARKVLLENLTGNSAWKNGRHAEAATTGSVENTAE